MRLLLLILFETENLIAGDIYHHSIHRCRQCWLCPVCISQHQPLVLQQPHTTRCHCGAVCCWHLQLCAEHNFHPTYCACRQCCRAKGRSCEASKPAWIGGFWPHSLSSKTVAYWSLRGFVCLVATCTALPLSLHHPYFLNHSSRLVERHCVSKTAEDHSNTLVLQMSCRYKLRDISKFNTSVRCLLYCQGC